MRMLTYAALFSLTALAQEPEPKQVTWTGWFGDAGCSRGRASESVITPPNPVCAEQCIAKGTAAVFVSEQAREVFVVKDYSGVVQNLGYHLEITGRADGVAKTISVANVKRISEYQGPSCARPAKKR